MAVTLLSSEAERTKDLARLGFSFGLGMVFGPSLGGLITTRFGYEIKKYLDQYNCDKKNLNTL